MALESALRGPFQIPSSLHLLRWASLGVGIWHWGWQDRKEKQVWRLVVGWEGWVEKRGFRIFQILLRSYKLPKKRRKKRTCIIYQTHHRHWAGPLHRLSPLGLISSQQHKHCYTHFTEMGPENQGSESSSVCKKSRSRWVAQQRLPLCVPGLFLPRLPSYTAWLPAHRNQNSGRKRADGLLCWPRTLDPITRKTFAHRHNELIKEGIWDISCALVITGNLKRKASSSLF